MNFYSYSKTQNNVKAFVGEIAPLLATNEDLTITDTNIYIESQAKRDVKVGKRLATSSEFTSEFENIDLPQVVKGNLVISALLASDDQSKVKKYYDNYFAIDFLKGDEKNNEPAILYIGFSNSTKTQTNAPFEEAMAFVVLDVDKLSNEMS